MAVFLLYETFLFFNISRSTKNAHYSAIMKKACPYCGKIHDKNYICPKKPKGKYHNRTEPTEADIFRGSYEWKCKREQVLKRDLYMCVACRHNIPGTIRRYNNEELSVHHIKPLITNYELRLDDDNLITLCRVHHEMAEKADIKPEILKKLLTEYPPQG